MPKINSFRPAAVYAPELPGAQERLLPVLAARRLYVLDNRTEALEHLSLPVVSRPVLRLHLLHASVGAEHGAAAFVTDDLSTVSGDETERVAVIGALLQVGCQVIIGDADIDGRWYQDRVHQLGYAAVGQLIEALLGFATDADWLLRCWPSAKTDGLMSLLPTSLNLRYADARLRAKELKEFDGLTVMKIAEQLAAEGHRNSDARHVWYAKSVRQALEQGL